jgi:hypothetical protein
MPRHSVKFAVASARRVYQCLGLRHSLEPLPVRVSVEETAREDRPQQSMRDGVKRGPQQPGCSPAGDARQGTNPVCVYFYRSGSRALTTDPGESWNQQACLLGRGAGALPS